LSLQVAQIGEGALIAALDEIFGEVQNLKNQKNLLFGIGDDGAVLAPSELATVATMDLAVEDVHFKTDWSTAHQIGSKVAVSNIADIYAMGGDPHSLLVGISLTGQEEVDWVLDLARGIAEEAKKVGAQVIGGDTVRGEKITIAITALGNTSEPIYRSGAKVGDQLVISGLPGASAAGLALLKADKRELFPEIVKAHLQPSVDGKKAHSLISAGATAMCDLSDGLLVDVTRISEASGVGIKIDLDHLDLSSLVEVGNALAVDSMSWVLTSGEEHLFIATLPPSAALPKAPVYKTLQSLDINAVRLALETRGLYGVVFVKTTEDVVVSYRHILSVL
jgi:thiamine-monophosphate kinase